MSCRKSCSPSCQGIEAVTSNGERNNINLARNAFDGHNETFWDWVVGDEPISSPCCGVFLLKRLVTGILFIHVYTICILALDSLCIIYIVHRKKVSDPLDVFW